jgi:hypothetical protein
MRTWGVQLLEIARYGTLGPKLFVHAYGGSCFSCDGVASEGFGAIGGDNNVHVSFELEVE